MKKIRILQGPRARDIQRSNQFKNAHKPLPIKKRKSDRVGFRLLSYQTRTTITTSQHDRRHRRRRRVDTSTCDCIAGMSIDDLWLPPPKQAAFPNRGQTTIAPSWTCLVQKAHEEIKKIWPCPPKTNNKKSNKKHDTSKQKSQIPRIPSMAPIQDCQLAHEHYDYWRPQRIRILLIAESHARTPQAIVGAKLALGFKKDDDNSHNKLGNIPGHLNLVHSLTYGLIQLLSEQDRHSLTRREHVSVSRGTAQFWRLLATLAGDMDYCPGEVDPLSHNDHPDRRRPMKEIFAHLEDKRLNVHHLLHNKLNVLRKLYQRGIHLIDASLVPFYVGGGTEIRVNQKTGRTYHTPAYKLPWPIKKKSIRVCWEEYTKFLVHDCKPDKILVLGKQVECAITREELTGLVDESTSDSKYEYLGAWQHPSYNCIQGGKFIPHLKEYRELGRQCEEASRRESSTLSS